MGQSFSAVKDRSVVNNLFFPRDNSSASYNNESFPGELAWIPRKGLGTAKQDSDGSVPVLVLPAPTGRASHIVLYTHGNGTDIGEMRDVLKALAKHMQVHVVAIEYPGYGVNTTGGTASESRINRDVEAVYRFLTAPHESGGLGWAAESIIAFGRSIGTGPAARLAVKEGLGGLVLVSPYTSIRDMASELAGGAAWLVSDRFVTKDELVKPGCPRTLIFHGTADDLIPVRQGRKLADRRADVHGADTQRFVPLDGIGHNDVFAQAIVTNGVVVTNRAQTPFGQMATNVTEFFPPVGPAKALDCPAHIFRVPPSALAAGPATTSRAASVLSQLFEMSGALTQNSSAATCQRFS